MLLSAAGSVGRFVFDELAALLPPVGIGRALGRPRSQPVAKKINAAVTAV
jgi:hypothetical protein